MIYCIIGGSGAGKTYLAKRMGLTRIVTATTRRPRLDEVNGCDYLFLDRVSFDVLVSQGMLYALTEYGGYLYGVPKQFDTFRDACVVVDARGACALEEECGSDNVTCILLDLPLEDRIDNMKTYGGLTNQEAVTRIKRDPPIPKHILEMCNLKTLRTKEEVDEFLREVSFKI